MRWILVMLMVSTANAAWTDSLVGYWKLDEASGNRVDSHGDNTLTPYASPGSAAGVVGDAVSLVATSSQYLEITDNASLSMGDISFTVSAWVYLVNKSASYNICGKWDGAGYYEYVLFYDSATDRFSGAASPFGGVSQLVVVKADNLGSPVTGTWYWLEFYRDHTSDILAIRVNNGTSNQAAFHVDGAFDGTAPFRVGRQQTSYMTGRVDELGVWKRRLTVDERAALYNSGNGLTYPFETASSYISKTAGFFFP